MIYDDYKRDALATGTIPSGRRCLHCNGNGFTQTLVHARPVGLDGSQCYVSYLSTGTCQACEGTGVRVELPELWRE